jgi:hypothetical protein
LEDVTGLRGQSQGVVKISPALCATGRELSARDRHCETQIVPEKTHGVGYEAFAVRHVNPRPDGIVLCPGKERIGRHAEQHFDLASRTRGAQPVDGSLTEDQIMRRHGNVPGASGQLIDQF